MSNKDLETRIELLELDNESNLWLFVRMSKAIRNLEKVNNDRNRLNRKLLKKLESKDRS